MSTGATNRRTAAPHRDPRSGAGQVHLLASQHDRDPLVASAVARVQDGAREAIPFLYLRYRDSVRSYVLTIVRDPHAAEDVALYTFLRLRSAIATYEPRTTPFSAWLLRLAREVALEHLRGQRLLAWEKVNDRPRVGDLVGDEHLARMELALDALVSSEEDNVIALRQSPSPQGVGRPRRR